MRNELQPSILCLATEKSGWTQTPVPIQKIFPWFSDSGDHPLTSKPAVHFDVGLAASPPRHQQQVRLHDFHCRRIWILSASSGWHGLRGIGRAGAWDASADAGQWFSNGTRTLVAATVQLKQPVADRESAPTCSRGADPDRCRPAKPAFPAFSGSGCDGVRSESGLPWSERPCGQGRVNRDWNILQAFSAGRRRTPGQQQCTVRNGEQRPPNAATVLRAEAAIDGTPFRSTDGQRKDGGRTWSTRPGAR